MNDVKTLEVKRLLDRREVEEAQFDITYETFTEMLRLLTSDALQQNLVLPKELQVRMDWLKLNPDEDADEMWIKVDKEADWTQVQLTAFAVCRTEEDVARDG